MRVAKYLLGDVPEKLENPAEMEQIYLKLDEPLTLALIRIIFADTKVLRYTQVKLRSKHDSGGIKYYMAIKGSGIGENLEDEREVPRIFYDKFQGGDLISAALRKTRYQRVIMPKNSGLITGIDIYRGKFNGLIIGEIEYSEAKYAAQDLLKLIRLNLGEVLNITDLKIFKGKNLAAAEDLTTLKSQLSAEYVSLIDRAQASLMRHYLLQTKEI